MMQIHYNPSKIDPEARTKFTVQQVQDTKQRTAQMRQFAGAVSQAIAADQCVGECRQQIDLLLQHFSAMSETITKLNQEQVMPEVLPLEQKAFALHNESARRCIRAIHLLPKH